MLTTAVLEAESSMVRDTLLVLVVRVRVMLLLGSLDLDNWDRASPPRLGRLNRGVFTDSLNPDPPGHP